MFQYFIRNTVDARVAELRAVQGTSLFLQKAVDAAEEGKTVENDWASRQAGKGAGGGMKASEEAIDDEVSNSSGRMGGDAGAQGLG